MSTEFLPFGEVIKRRRLELGMSLRAFCIKHQEDPGNWSKLERGVNPPPKDRDRIVYIAQMLELDVQMLSDIADIENQRIPSDIMTDKELVGHLPVLFRTIRGGVPSTEQLLKLAESVRLANTPDEQQ